MSSAKPGKTPISVKVDSRYETEDVEFNLLVLDSKLKSELESKGLVHRWVNKKEYLDKGNYHNSGWIAYLPDTDAGAGRHDFMVGRSPEGYIQRKDLILAVKTVGAAARQKERIKAKTKTAQAFMKQEASEMRARMKDAGVKGAKVHEGYEAEGDESDD
jgi:hypothetical protein